MRAASACDSKGQAKACVQQGHDRELPEWVHTPHLCVIVSAVCGKRTTNQGLSQNRSSGLSIYGFGFLLARFPHSPALLLPARKAQSWEAGLVFPEAYKEVAR